MKSEDYEKFKKDYAIEKKKISRITIRQKAAKIIGNISGKLFQLTITRKILKRSIFLIEDSIGKIFKL